MHSKGVRVALWSRDQTTLRVNATTPPEFLQNFLSRRSGAEVRLYRAGSDGLPERTRKNAVKPILQDMGVLRHETIMVGNEERDMHAGVNSGLLLVRPDWYPSTLEYGFSVELLGELAQFCELFGLRQHPIFWSVDDGNLHVRSMGPFSTHIPDFAIFGADARSAAKYDAGQRKFWFLMIVSSLYFSGMIEGVDFISVFPGHNPASISAVRRGMDSLMTTLGKCFRKPYLPDLIVRHTSCIKSQTAQPSQKTFLNQLNTLHLNPTPRRYDRPVFTDHCIERKARIGS